MLKSVAGIVSGTSIQILLGLYLIIEVLMLMSIAGIISDTSR